MFKFFIMMYTFLGMELFAVETLAIVNQSDITRDDVNAFVIKNIPGANFDVLTKKQKDAVVHQMIDRKLFLEDAKKTDIQKSSKFIAELQKMKENLLLDFWMKEKVEEIAISDRASKIYYRDNHEKFSQPASVKVRHILLATQEEAQKIIIQLKKISPFELKKKFMQLAKNKSTGPSAVNGGELDWFIKEQMVPEFSEVAFGLKIGSITEEPVHTQFGYHVIFLEDKKEKGSIPFETVKEDIVKALRLSKFKTKLKKLSQKMKKTAKIIVK